jgi:hypothetical protein
MKAAADEPQKEGRDEGWDETVLVWNATVARIRAPAIQPDPSRDIAGFEAGKKSAKRREPRAERFTGRAPARQTRRDC